MGHVLGEITHIRVKCRCLGSDVLARVYLGQAIVNPKGLDVTV